MNLKFCSMILITIFLGIACANMGPDTKYPTTQSPLELDRVVLYRNGIGYFERRGTIDGGILTLKVRKDQVNDLLKSLTVVDQSSGQALSISIPLDPLAWQNAALSTLSPGNGNLATILDGLRGTQLTVNTQEGRTIEGRIVMVEKLEADLPTKDAEVLMAPPAQLDHKLTLLDSNEISVVKLSEVSSLFIHDNDLVMQLHRRLDASAGEGMFQQVEIDIRLSSVGKHQLVVSYVVAAPLWKPTYRIILDDQNDGKALLQSWAVVDNTSGENWDNVSLSLTAGSPIAFRYDMHTPRNITRPDLSHSGIEKQAAVALGESTMNHDDDGKMEDMPEEEYQRKAEYEFAPPSKTTAKKKGRRSAAIPQTEQRQISPLGLLEKSDSGIISHFGANSGAASVPTPISTTQLQSSMKANTSAKRIAGLSQFDLGQRVTLPDGNATMVALINEVVGGEQTFLFKPGGAGLGYEYNPYRVVRFTNSTDFILEPGPISIYAKGSFIGEGLSDAVAGKADTTIPFAVEPRIVVRSTNEHQYSDASLTKIVQGVLYTERFRQVQTTWSVKGMKTQKGYTVLIRHPRAGRNYDLVAPENKLEELNDAYFIPISILPNTSKNSVKVIEQTPSHTTMTIWDGNATALLTQFLRLENLEEKTKKQIQPIVTLRQEIGKIDTKITGLKSQQRELDKRAEQTRQNLQAIKKDVKATALRKKLNRRLEEFSQKAAQIGRTIVELNSQRLEKKINLEDLLKDFSINPKRGKNNN